MPFFNSLAFGTLCSQLDGLIIAVKESGAEIYMN